MRLTAVAFRSVAASMVFAVSFSVQANDNSLVERGQQLFESCATCHQIGPGAKHAIGPSLNNVLGRPIGSAPGFTYSQVMAAAGRKGKAWDQNSVDALLKDPAAYLEGTTMIGKVADKKDRDAIISYLGSKLVTATPATADTAVSAEILAIQGDPEYGEYLASECVTCHQADGSNQGIPSITGWSIPAFVTVMHAYKSHSRSNEVMRNVAGALGNDEIAALAAWFKTQ